MKRVLVAPLDWGLGHATRCIPIIRELLKRNADVVIAGSSDSLALLKEEFPLLPCEQLPGYTPKYPRRRGSMVWTMAMQLPRFVNVIREEHQYIERLVKSLKIDVIISDNRYGCWSSVVPSIFITHQSNILMPKRFGWMAGMVRRANLRMMKKFSECWLPDFPGGGSLAGILANFSNDDEGLTIRHIGALSRFQFDPTAKKDVDVIAIFSGPEPQRSLFEQRVYDQLRRSKYKYIVVRGKFNGDQKIDDPNVHQFMNASQLEYAIQRSEVIIARSGYSTVMDLLALRKKAILVPTPGQTEQEYLAKRLGDKNIVYTVSQDVFDFNVAMQKVGETVGFPEYAMDTELLDSALDHLLR